MARSGKLDPVSVFRFDVQIISLSLSPGNAFNAGAGFSQFGRVGFSAVDIPEFTNGVMEYRENLDAPVFKKYPGLMRFSDVTLQRGVVQPPHDAEDGDGNPIKGQEKGKNGNSSKPSKDFYRWLTKVNSVNPVMLLMAELANFQNTGIQSNSDNYRKDAVIILRGRDGAAAKRWYLVNVWPSAYKGSTDLSANAEELAIERLSLTCEAVFELPSFADAAKEFIASTVDNDLVGELADIDVDLGF